MSKKSITFAAKCKNAPARDACAYIGKEQKIDKVCAMKTKETKSSVVEKVSKFWDACQRLRGNIEVYDPMLLA